MACSARPSPERALMRIARCARPWDTSSPLGPGSPARTCPHTMGARRDTYRAAPTYVRISPLIGNDDPAGTGTASAPLETFAADRRSAVDTMVPGPIAVAAV